MNKELIDESNLITVRELVCDIVRGYRYNRMGAGIFVLIDDSLRHKCTDDVYIYLNSIGIVSVWMKMLVSSKITAVIFELYDFTDKFNGFPSNILSLEDFLIKLLDKNL
jgi:hypothetical protein